MLGIGGTQVVRIRWTISKDTEWEIYEEDKTEGECSLYPCLYKPTHISKGMARLWVTEKCGGCSGPAQMMLCDLCFEKHLENVKSDNTKSENIQYDIKVT
jgi:hypothetical protein